jgi:hypothetical protein
MNHKEKFTEILDEAVADKAIKDATKHLSKLFKGDKQFAKLKKEATKKKDKIVDLLDYVYSAQGKEIESIMKKTGMDFDDMADIVANKIKA